MKMASSSGMSETTHHDGSHLLLLGKRKLESFQKPFLIAVLQSVPHL